MISLALAAVLTTSTSFQQALNVLPQEKAIASSPLRMVLSDSEAEEKARQEIKEMCAALEDKNVSLYLRFPTINIEKVYYDYEQQYQKPCEELKEILARLNDIKEYVPQESLEDIDPMNNLTDTISQVKANLEKVRAIQEIAENNYQDAIENNAALAGRESGLNKISGINYYDGRLETYYSSRVLYHDRTSDWLLDSEGFYRTSEGYYVVAASDMPQGTIFEGSKGLCCVLDSGCDNGVTDYYVNW